MCVNAKMDNKRIEDKLDVTKEKKKEIAKDPATTKLLKDCMRENPLFKRCRDDARRARGRSPPPKGT